MTTEGRLFGDGTRRSKGDQARRYNLLAARLIAELIKNSLGPRGLEKMFVDIMGEVTVTKDGATLLRKIDVEHPAAKVIIEASNAVDNEVGDGTTSVVVLTGALVQKAEELLDIGISPSTISEGYLNGLNIALKALNDISKEYDNTDRQVMERLVRTCIQSKVLAYDDKVAGFVVDAVCTIANFSSNSIDTNDIKIEEIEGMLDAQLVAGEDVDEKKNSLPTPKGVEKNQNKTTKNTRAKEE